MRIEAWRSETPERQTLCEKLFELRRIVTHDLESFRLVFPEYTPHDIHLHAERLIRLAASILAPNIETLNVVEYLILTAAIYAHDWGMSVSEDEKEAIRRTLEPASSRDISAEAKPGVTLLDDEKLRLSEYLQELQDRVGDAIPEELSVHEWAGYLRTTHGRRSGARIRAFFQDTHARFGRYLALVAEGHTATEDEIAGSGEYRPKAAPVLTSPSINLQALTIYLRLLDLFDISDERTPFALWRGVNPQDTQSRIEWAKHMSLAPVHLDARTGALLFEGEVHDPQVWACVCDLRRYCEQQFAFSRSLLNKQSDAEYRLPFHWLDWEGVVPKGIPAEIVRFRFERDAMFSLLSEDVYDRDPYVFIRELLQNAIDATSTRERVLKNTSATLPSFAPILVRCDSRPKGDYTLEITDIGTGMDSFIVQNYLAVSGKSFYRSRDFRRLGIDYDAISRFGIGILSCFMVADVVEIETHPDRNVFPNGSPLRIRIENLRNHWAIVDLPSGNTVGTTVKVFVSARKVAALQAEKTEYFFQERRLTRSQLAVTDYLKAIAGFVPYPILVDENEKRTAILHPKDDGSRLPDTVKNSYQIQKLGLDYDLSRAVTPGSIEAARRFLRIETVHLDGDLTVNGIDGSVSFAVPVDPEFIATSMSMASLVRTQGIAFYSFNRGSNSGPLLALSESAAKDPFVACFCDGILVPKADYPIQLAWEGQKGDIKSKCGTSAIPAVQVCLNIKHGHLNMARNRLPKGGGWADAALDVVGRQYVDRWREELLAATPLQRLRLLARYGQFYPVSLFRIADMIGVDNWPVCVCGTNGRIDVKSWREFACDMLATIPEELNAVCTPVLEDLLRNTDSVELPDFKKWAGFPLLLGPSDKWVGCSHYEPLSHIPLMLQGYEAQKSWIMPPLPGYPPIETKIWVRPGVQAGTIESPTGRMTRSEMMKIAKGWCMFDHNDDERYPVTFNTYCFWGPRLVNERHGLGAALLEAIRLPDRCPHLDWKTDRGQKLQDLFQAFLCPDPSRDSRMHTPRCYDFSIMHEHLQAMAVLVQPHDPVLADKLAKHTIRRADFLPGVFLPREDGQLVHAEYDDYGGRRGINLVHCLRHESAGEWGQLLGPDSPWPTWADIGY